MQYSFYTSPKYNNFTTKAYKKPTNVSLTNCSVLSLLIIAQAVSLLTL